MPPSQPLKLKDVKQYTRNEISSPRPRGSKQLIYYCQNQLQNSSKIIERYGRLYFSCLLGTPIHMHVHEGTEGRTSPLASLRRMPSALTHAQPQTRTPPPLGQLCLKQASSPFHRNGIDVTIECRSAPTPPPVTPSPIHRYRLSVCLYGESYANAPR